MHQAITKAFKKYRIFGFTGAPIFPSNAGHSGSPLLRTIPDDISLNRSTNETLTAFEASFDFMDAVVGFVLCVPKMEAASGF